MSDDISRMRTLAGINRAPFDVMDDDAAQDMRDAEFDAQYAREAHVTALIVSVCKRVGLPLDGSDRNHGVLYDESDREARITLDDFEIDLAKLTALGASGIGSGFRVVAAGQGLDITFTVDPAMDTARL